MKNQVQNRLYTETQGSIGSHGYVVAVLEILNISQGLLFPSDPNAHYDVTFKAIVFKPAKYQVIDAVVTTVNKMGFFAEIGPMQVFVSSHLVPPQYRFDPDANPPAYTSTVIESEAHISKGSLVRVRIIGTRVDQSEIFAIGTIKEDFLGHVV